MELQAAKTEKLENFRIRLKAAMSRRGVTLEQVARQLKLSTSTVGAWAQGKNFPQTELQPDLAELLGTTVAHLVHGISVKRETENPFTLAEEPAPYFSARGLGAAAAADRGPVKFSPGYAPRPPEPTPQACIDYFLTYLKAAEHAPGGVGVTWWKLQKNFPLDEFDPVKK